MSSSQPSRNQTLPELRSILASLLHNWSQRAHSDSQFETRRGITRGRFVTEYGIAAHAHRLGHAIASLYQDQLYLEAMPTIRAAFEHGLTAMWVAQYPDAAAAFVNEGYRNRALLATSANTGWGMAIELTEAADGWKPLPTDLTATARNFKALCDSLSPGGEQAYSIYRMLSSLAHPGPHLVDHTDGGKPASYPLPRE